MKKKNLLWTDSGKDIICHDYFQRENKKHLPEQLRAKSTPIISLANLIETIQHLCKESQDTSSDI